jgi:hypothetical protein
MKTLYAAASLALLTSPLTSTSIASSPSGTNEDVIVMVSKVLHDSSLPSPKLKQEMVMAASRVLRSVPDVGADRRAHISEHLQVYLRDQVNVSPQISDGQVEVVVGLFEWALRTYSTLVPVAQSDRLQMRQSVALVRVQIETVINATYTDTPPNIRNQLVMQVCDNIVGPIDKQIGNYFYVQYLYPSHHNLSSADLNASLLRSPLLRDNASKFAPVAKRLDRKKLSEKSRKAIIDSFVYNESAAWSITMANLLRPLFNHKKVLEGDIYKPPPHSLLAKQNQMSQEMHDTAVAEGQAQLARAEHERQVNSLLQGTHLTYINGTIQGSGPALKEPSQKASIPPSNISYMPHARTLFVAVGGVLLVTAAALRAVVRKRRRVT